jgi:hypothetical protein
MFPMGVTFTEVHPLRRLREASLVAADEAVPLILCKRSG